MQKNIVLCTDGTWNGPGAEDDRGNLVPSNVQKLFERLVGTQPLRADQNEAEIEYKDGNGTVLQVAKYIHGVGDSSNVLTKVAEGSTGDGLLARLVRGYTFISRVYAPGDRIFLIGFSRGAYTARALAGLIVQKGLLNWAGMGLGAGNDSVAYAAGMTAWADFRNTSKAADKSGFIQQINDFVFSAKTRLLSGLAHDPVVKYLPNIKITGIGVWDTVGSLGVPLYTQEDGTRPDLFKFIDTALNSSVENGFHALAIDEEREDFTPTFWDKRDNVKQVLFPGAHGDVGGGYPPSNPYGGRESGLSDGALQWMLNETKAVGVLFKAYTDIVPDSGGVGHQPWCEPFYQARSQVQRQFPLNVGFLVSATVVTRMAAGLVILEGPIRNSNYRPSNLAGTYLNAQSNAVLTGIIVA